MSRILASLRLRGRGERAVSTALVLLAAMSVAYALTGFPVADDFAKVLEAGIGPDVIHEIATAREALDGDPHRSLAEILPEHGFVVHSDAGVSPRPPAAYLLQLPLLLIPPESVARGAITGILLVLVGIVLISRHMSGLDWRRTGWSAPLLVISLPVVTAISYGSLSVLTVVMLILVAWRSPDDRTSGIAVGVAAAWRLWPGLLIAGLWISGRRRAAYLAGSVFVLISAAGVMLPGVTLAGSVETLVAGAGDWINHNMNSSLALVLYPYGVPALAATTLVSIGGLLIAWRHEEQAYAVCVVTALLASPLSWPSYSLALLPVCYTWMARGRSILVGLSVAPAVLWFLIPAPWRGHGMFLVLVVALVATRHLSGAPKDLTRSGLGKPEPPRGELSRLPA